MPRQLSGFTEFNPSMDIPSLSGKVIFVTGGTAGVGKSTLEQLAQHQPAHLYFTGRNQSAAKQVIKLVKAAQPSISITFIQMDLSSLASVKSAVAQFTHDRLDLLICNGGIMDVPPAISVDGFEIHVATNHLGHALLIDKLLPVMLQTAFLLQADVRIVILSSAGFALHPKDGLAWDKLSSAQSGFVESMTRYGQSKLANLVYAAELARRYPQILSVSIHPGFVATNLIHNSSALAKFYSYGRHWLRGESILSPHQGSLNSLWVAAGAERNNLVNGAYYEPIGVLRKPDGLPSSEEFAKRVWTWTDGVLTNFR
ncbi:unnamed protein product [Clonostachys chloroleuca]|uniref:Uncharacterized protein n=1 Tax=Clonostachys chloroleuca TaxID=1926264 RepID=A0AA35M0P0_9HYPO|nr:unnamed protein product [Clonostachys chloroleuca]